MKRKPGMLLVSLLLMALPAYPQGGQGTGTVSGDDKAEPADDAQRLATGQITKIDIKKRIFTVREVSNSAPPPTSRNPGTGRDGGRGGMGGRRGGRGGGRVPASTPKDKGKEFNVTVTDHTEIKDAQGTIPFGLLRIGDRITIQGLPKGKGADLEATLVTVNH
jgi:hypothetical protein